MKTGAVVALGLALAACSANREVATHPEPAGLSAYLATRHPSDILVTDARGDSHWVHNPTVVGDTLRGVRGRDLPQLPIALPIGDVTDVEEPHFSTGKTLGLVGAVLVVTAAALVIALGGTRAVPVY